MDIYEFKRKIKSIGFIPIRDYLASEKLRYIKAYSVCVYASIDHISLSVTVSVTYPYESVTRFNKPKEAYEHIASLLMGAYIGE